MISGKRRIPLVYSNQKAKDPIYFKYVPDKLRIIKFGCLCPPPIPLIPEYVLVSGTNGVNPGSGNFTIILSGAVDPGTLLPIYVLQFSNTFKNSSDATSFLNNMSTATSISLIKDVSNFYNFTRLTSTNNGSYWSFNTVVTSLSGGFNFGDTVTLTYS